MDTLMGACYFFTVAGISYNLMKIKLQIDLEEDLKNLREYDLSTEKIRVGTDKIIADQQYIVLAKHKSPAKASVDQNTKEEPKLSLPLFSYTQACSAPYDPTRYMEGQKLKEQFSMVIDEDIQDMPFEV